MTWVVDLLLGPYLLQALVSELSIVALLNFPCTGIKMLYTAADDSKKAVIELTNDLKNGPNLD